MRATIRSLSFATSATILMLAVAIGTPTRAAAGVDPPPPPPTAHVEPSVEGAPVPGRSGGGCPSSPTGTCTNDLGMPWSPSRGCWVTSDVNYTTMAKRFAWVISAAAALGYSGYFQPGGPGWNAFGGAGQTTGAIYYCLDPACSAATAPCDTVDIFWSPGALVSPGQLAERAVAAMDLHAPAVGMTGGDPPDHMQYVGLPAWMWAADPGESTTGPITRSAADGGISVTATGVLDKTVWSMGDGVSVTCAGANAPGTPFEARYAGQSSPTCGYTYTRTSAGKPNECFTVTVTSYWTVTWAGGGESGTIPVQVSRSVQKKVGEIQVLVVKPGGGS